MSFVSVAPVLGLFVAGHTYPVKGIATTGLR
ncbi:hypothetical protein J2S41_003373 [Catenuloplanes atrovinosus]|uniref:Uncharacterized protein n=1 Tax=Catenuloplanes atrovinosus TaxID=137266 RepID=A0AAE3YQ60_9ACTN|nr:hypothetical protein [Catenuloplanes atrovinosus]